ncbi:hypothetical protein HMPREF1146_0658 [Prevotella sp. MSX73]|nr:hypothetical protein HMPREF1146_0658 [Prevotella sp. MSX73]
MTPDAFRTFDHYFYKLFYIIHPFLNFLPQKKSLEITPHC